MNLIFDCGSTKCTIVQRDDEDNYLNHVTIGGYNPLLHADVNSSFKNHFETSLNSHFSNISKTTFCGAGCVEDVTKSKIKAELKKIFKGSKCEVYSDLEFIGHILKIKEKSIIGILGTGSNAGLWNGNIISHNTLSGGYLLGDEGSAFVLGKKLLINYIRNNFEPESQKILKGIIQTEIPELIKILYTANLPNKKIASYAPLLQKITDPLKDKIVKQSIEEYVKNRVIPLVSETQIIHLFGSVAYFNQDYIKPIFEKLNLHLGIVSKGPLDLIIKR